MTIRRDELIVKLLTIHIKQNKGLYKSFNYSHSKQKYKLSEYLKEILYVLKTGISWRDIRTHINWNSIYKVYIRLNKHCVFKIAYNDLLIKYLKRGVNNKLKFIITDTTFIPNKNGADKMPKNIFFGTTILKNIFLSIL